MPCYHEIAAFQLKAGTPLFFGKIPPRGARRIHLPCGQCVGCRLEGARQWAVRCMHEAQMYEQNCFLTLTYDDDHLPQDGNLNHRDFQLFMKKFRRRGHNVRFFMGGEYGETNSRPHYHAIMFGWYPPDRKFWKKSGAGFKVYTSEYTDKIWGKGVVYIGDVSFESASYIARYTLKKVASDGKQREILDVTTGEIIKRNHEYGKMSLRPGIGAEWVKKFATDIYPHDGVRVRGTISKLPRYYDTLLSRVSPLYIAEIKAKRVEKADAAYDRLIKENWNDRFTDLKRPKVHEKVKLAAIKLLKRT